MTHNGHGMSSIERTCTLWFISWTRRLKFTDSLSRMLHWSRVDWWTRWDHSTGWSWIYL